MVASLAEVQVRCSPVVGLAECFDSSVFRVSPYNILVVEDVVIFSSIDMVKNGVEGVILING